MGWLLLTTRVVLAIVFVSAGLAKLFDPKGTKKAIIDFGVPPWAAGPLRIALPMAEITVAALLLPIRTVWVGAVGALALLIAFSAAIAVNIALGRRPQCHCFGQIHSEPIGWGTLVRNGVLAGLSAAVVFEARSQPGQSIYSALYGMRPQQLFMGTFAVLTMAALATLSWLILHLFRQNGRLLLRIEALEANRAAGQFAHQQMPARPVPQGLPIGSKAIPFDLPKLGGRASLEGFLRDGKPLLLISTDPKCGPCNALMPDIAGWQKSLTAELNVVLLSHGRFADNRAKAAEFGLTNVVVEKDHKIAEKYQALGTPTGVLIRADGTIGSPAVSGADGIRQLVTNKAWTEMGLATLMKSFAQPTLPAPPKPTLPIGSPAPAFALTDLNGKTVESAQFNGNGTMLVFWNPACGFCQRMLPQLKEWEKSRPEKSPQLVLVSSGSREANRAMGLSSPVLIDDKFSVGQRYGASGTPSGSLIDKDGKIAAGLAVGEPTIMEILTGTKDKGNSAKVAVASAS